MQWSREITAKEWQKQKVLNLTRYTEQIKSHHLQGSELIKQNNAKKKGQHKTK